MPSTLPLASSAHWDTSETAHTTSVAPDLGNAVPAVTISVSVSVAMPIVALLDTTDGEVADTVAIGFLPTGGAWAEDLLANTALALFTPVLAALEIVEAAEETPRCPGLPRQQPMIVLL